MATPIPFSSSQRSTLGVEWELALVDKDSGDLRQVAQTILDAVSPDGSQHPHVRQELLLNTVEIVTGVCNTVAEAGEDLQRSIELLHTLADPLRVELMCAGTHPFARWNNQKVTDKERYATLIDRTQWWGRQMLIYGIHVHVGVEDRNKVLPISRALLSYLGHIQSLSASSPFWGGKDTAYASNRALMFQQLPTAGLPTNFDEWSELEQYVDDMVKVGVIDEFNEIRWDVRPSPHYGTIEARIADGASNLTEVLALAALTQCLVEHFSTLLDEGKPLPHMQPWFVQENKWRSARYGMDAILILDESGREDLVSDDLLRLLRELEPTAARLGCETELDYVRVILRKGASYQRQRAVARRNGGDLGQVVSHLVKEFREGKPL
ncbi:glutamate--cysteine ligase [Populibacterium corticicola]|uniref:Putative glutamate--cysteine ligase 2 n=1 Tax=Populibacterium corticicola TaxID=1812826 RepID=A0ABW5XJH8_9MICO